MSVAWWCQTCGTSIPRPLLVVRVGATAIGERSLNTYCSDGCAAHVRNRGEVAVTEVRLPAARPARSHDALSVLEEILSLD
jgi:hypothetical protein